MGVGWTDKDIVELKGEMRTLIELGKKQCELLEQILRVFKKYDEDYLTEVEAGDIRPG